MSKIMKEITAAQAAHIAKTNPHDEVRERREKIMKGIKEYSDSGNCCYSVISTHRDIFKEDVDWLTGLGYMVFRWPPDKYGYSYSIYWMEDGQIPWAEPFAPGERWAKIERETSGAI